MSLTVEQIAAVAGRPLNDNMRSVLIGLERRGDAAGLSLPHRLAHYLSQLSHESGGFRHDVEVWGPTPAQARYDARTDLGNSAAIDGDGYLYRGRTAIQITGRANYAAFSAWVRAVIDPAAPDFAADPDQILTDPWEGLAPIWYWESRPKLGAYADAGDVEMVTRLINGGTNGLPDRLERYARAALVLLGRDPAAIREFQREAGLAIDGIAGPRTRAALHQALVATGTRALALPGTSARPSWLARLLNFLFQLLRESR